MNQDDRPQIDSSNKALRTSEAIEFGLDLSGADFPTDFELCKGLTLTLD